MKRYLVDEEAAFDRLFEIGQERAHIWKRERELADEERYLKSCLRVLQEHKQCVENPCVHTKLQPIDLMVE